MTTLEDEAAVGRVLARYCHTCDDGNFDEFGELWADDAELVIGDVVRRGRADVVDEIAGRQPPERRGVHITANVIVTVDGDRARAESDYLFLRMSSTGRLFPAVAGRYVDVLSCGTDRAWRFERREIRFLAGPGG